MAHRLNTDPFYTACWVERTSRKHHITGATARRVQVSIVVIVVAIISLFPAPIHVHVSNLFRGETPWAKATEGSERKQKLVSAQLTLSSDLAFSFNKMINDHLRLFLIRPSSFLASFFLSGSFPSRDIDEGETFVFSAIELMPSVRSSRLRPFLVKISFSIYFY